MIDCLEELEDITDTLIFEDEPSILTHEHAVDMLETALHLMDEYMNENPNAMADPDFHENLLEEIKDIFYIQMEEHILSSDYVEDDLNDILDVAFDIYISTFHVERSHFDTTVIDKKDEHNLIADKIQGLKNIPQPVQRTSEWYIFRWNLITASNAWKAFESQSTMNQLIYEKCQPLKDFSIAEDEIVMVNTNSTLHWGQKYEPLSVLIYEYMYKLKVEDFGCIKHPKYDFIGASPDGIITDMSSDRYGRMLEIKNIVNREINGIPKKEYWIQMQLQMEVCDLDECDFLETKFTEYPDYNSYKNDIIADDMFKGTIIYFHTKEGAPHYEYMPLNLKTLEEVSGWEEETLQKFESKYVFIKFLYWKLEKLSCVLVKRNREWFNNNVGQMEKVWKIIEEERVSGYEHRAPKKNKSVKNFVKNTTENPEVCVLKVIKLG